MTAALARAMIVQRNGPVRMRYSSVLSSMAGLPVCHIQELSHVQLKRAGRRSFANAVGPKHQVRQVVTKIAAGFSELFAMDTGKRLNQPAATKFRIAKRSIKRRR